MIKDFLSRVLLLIVFILLQVFLIGKVNLYGCIMPMPYIYIVIAFPRNYSKWAILLWAWGTGIIIDAFYNTVGIAAASLTIVGAIQPILLNVMLKQDSLLEIKPNIKTMGAIKYILYVVMLTLLYCLLFFSLEMLSPLNCWHWAKCVAGSTIATAMMVIFIDILSSFGKYANK